MAHTINVLAVDDTPANLVALEAVLSDGCNVVRAGSGSEAITILESRSDIDVILMDVQMPELDGFETASLLKQRESTRDIPIVFVTAVYRDDPWARQGYAVGGIDYFTKPFDPDLLKLKVGIYGSLKQRGDFLRERERQLHLSEALLSTARNLTSTLETADTGLIIADMQGDVQQMNDEVFRIFGCPQRTDDPDALEGNRRFICEQLVTVLGAAREGRVPHRDLVRIGCGDGVERTVLCSISLLRGSVPAASALALVICDVTRAMRIEGDLAQQVAELESSSR